ncbi:UrcA family protein [Congregibacter sp.]|uniref:UrcA family protein n=1 Tax=Congregibacter sp. TaxID=2744308 RepID=UPI003F6CAEED
MKSIRRVLFATAVSGVLAAFAVQASASSITEVIADSVTNPTQVAVNFSDLDLDSATGQKVLHYRLARAAEQACGHSDIRRAGSVARAARNMDCYEQSLSRALSKVNASAVAAAN